MIRLECLVRHLRGTCCSQSTILERTFRDSVLFLTRLLFKAMGFLKKLKVNTSSNIREATALNNLSVLLSLSLLLVRSWLQPLLLTLFYAYKQPNMYPVELGFKRSLYVHFLDAQAVG